MDLCYILLQFQIKLSQPPRRKNYHGSFIYSLVQRSVDRVNLRILFLQNFFFVWAAPRLPQKIQLFLFLYREILLLERSQVFLQFLQNTNDKKLCLKKLVLTILLYKLGIKEKWGWQVWTIRRASLQEPSLTRLDGEERKLISKSAALIRALSTFCNQLGLIFDFGSIFLAVKLFLGGSM